MYAAEDQDGMAERASKQMSGKPTPFQKKNSEVHILAISHIYKVPRYRQYIAGGHISRNRAV